MKHKPIYSNHMINPDQLRDGLTALVKEHGSTQSMDLRNDVLNVFKSATSRIYEQAEIELHKNNNGLKCARLIAGGIDRLIGVIHDFAIHYAYPAYHQNKEDRICIAAVGGYGRATLAPKSDIDILFILPGKKQGNNESVIEYILYMLWDLGFKVGHSVRTVDECIKYAQEDMTITTALLERRYILGNRTLYTYLDQSFETQIKHKLAKTFVESKLAERSQRHKKAGKSRYRVEPDIKEGKGGLRDIQTLFWLISFVYGAKSYNELVKMGILSKREVNSFKRCEKFLWTTRCYLHFLTKRADEKLSFDRQLEIAQAIGYHEGQGLKDVERFMKHYFLVAREVGYLTRVILTDLEVKHLKSAPLLHRVIHLFRNRTETIKNFPQFIIDGNRISIHSEELFLQDKCNFLQIFKVAQNTGLELHPNAMRLLSTNLNYIDAPLRKNSAANEIFMEILISHSGVEETLREMNDVGVLGRFIPDFRKIVSMMQFNMYHHYTVDEHLLYTVGVLQDIEQGNFAEEHPLSDELMKSISNRNILYVSALIHDIAKGRKEDHSIAGAKIAKKLCPRLGMSKAETEMVSWLVLEHLTMSNISQSRDISDRKTIVDFVSKMQSLERMKYLLILTVCDIRAVGPGVWNGWKGQLLRALYYAAEPFLTGGHSELTRTAHIEESQELLRLELADYPQDQLEAYIAQHYAPYWLRTDKESLIEHAKLLLTPQLEKHNAKLRFHALSDRFEGITALTIYAPDHPHLLSIIAGICAMSEANIIDAQIFTTRDGYVLDTVRIKRRFEDDKEEFNRADLIFSQLADVLGGKKGGTKHFKMPRKLTRRQRAFRVPTIVRLNNNLSNKFTVIDAETTDRQGLLFDFTTTISKLNLNIASAHITTFGEKAVDSFYVTDLTGQKITDKKRIEKIRITLENAISPENLNRK